MDLGLNPDTFNQCLDSGQHKEDVTTDTQIAQQIGVRSTPTFLVNGTPVQGAQPYSEFETLIKQGLGQQ